MGFFKRYKNYDEWSQTERGKSFNEKMKKIAEQNAKNKEEYEKNTPPEKKEQVKLFKKIFTPVFIVFAIAMYWAFYSYKVIPVYVCEVVIAAASFVLFKRPPKKVKYPNCFMMPVIALFCSTLFSLYLCTNFGFDRVIKFAPEKVTEIEVVEEEPPFKSMVDFFESDYTQWIEESGIQSREELESDFKKTGVKE